MLRPIGDKLGIGLSKGTLAVFAAGFTVSSSHSVIGTLVFDMTVFTDPFALDSGFKADFICGIGIVNGILGKESR